MININEKGLSDWLIIFFISTLQNYGCNNRFRTNSINESNIFWKQLYMT